MLLLYDGLDSHFSLLSSNTFMRTRSGLTERCWQKLCRVQACRTDAAGGFAHRAAGPTAGNRLPWRAPRSSRVLSTSDSIKCKPRNQKIRAWGTLRFYCQDIRAYDILFGELPRPAQAEDLYEILDTFTEKYESAGQRANARRDARQQHKASAKDLPPTPASRPQRSSAPGQLDPDSQSNLTQPIEVTALYSFEGQQPGDLNFQAGDRITVTSKTDSQFDWWEGKLRGQTGIFPANYVTMN
uniref:SH3 domain-containing YSC84-like protein 1 n=1 Tax=Oryctolagus cuniculus TaxID=9986 RepID=A0A5F9CMU9_RABIT